MYPRRPIARWLSSLLTLAVALLLALPAAPAHLSFAQTPSGTDLMLVIDGSGSIAPRDFEVARTFSLNLVNACFQGAVRIGVVQFSTEGQTRLESPLTDNKGAVVNALTAMPQIDGLTDIQEGLNVARQQFDTNGVAGNQRVIILLTDGQQQGPGDPVAEAGQFKQAGGTIYAVGIGTGINLGQLNQISSDPDRDYTYAVANFTALNTILARLALGSCNVVIDEEQIARNRAEISVVQRPNANHGATAGSIVTTEIVTVNRGKGRAKDVVITVPFNPAEVRVLDATFSTTQAWVSSVLTDSLTIQTGSIGANGIVTGTLRMQVLATVSLGTSLAEQLFFTWSDGTGGGTGVSNMPILSVAATTDHRPTYTMTVDPASAPAGSTFTFSSALFAPREPIGVWYNRPDGKVGDETDTFRANDDGTITVTFETADDLPPGNYSMVFYGHWTEFTAVVPFTVTR